MRAFAVQWNIVFRTVTEANASGGSGLLEEECLCCRENTLAQVSDLWVPKCCHEYGNRPLISSLEHCTAKPPHGASPRQHMQSYIPPCCDKMPEAHSWRGYGPLLWGSHVGGREERHIVGVGREASRSHCEEKSLYRKWCRVIKAQKPASGDSFPQARIHFLKAP